MAMVHLSTGRFTACGKRLAVLRADQLCGTEDRDRLSCDKCAVSTNRQTSVGHETLEAEAGAARSRSGTGEDPDGTSWEEDTRAASEEAERRRLRDSLIEQDWGYGSFLAGERRVSRMLGEGSRSSLAQRGSSWDPSDLNDPTRL